MAILARLSIQGLRNLSQIELAPAPGFNLIHGENGAGKTSLLEAIYMLGHGRTFRSHQIRPVISEGLDRVTLFTQTTQGITLGLERKHSGSPVIHVNGMPAENLADLTYSIPVQLINNDSLEILEGGPLERRRFLDWGVFHVEHQFLPAWRNAKKALKHRNSLLRSGATKEELSAWSQSLSAASVVIDKLRSRYVIQLKEELLSLLSQNSRFEEMLGSVRTFSIRYERGWPEQGDLKEVLSDTLIRDRKYGFTTYGPHRADLVFEISGKSLSTLLSRGQLKFLVFLLKIAQARVLDSVVNKQCIFLIDDLPAELDLENRRSICTVLAQMKSPFQFFLTSIEKEPLYSEVAEVQETGRKIGLFHVKHGTIIT